MRKMATGALIVAAAYLLLAIVAFVAEPGRASWLWLVLFFAIFTLGELYILPTGLGLFARLAPVGFGATTVAAWFLAIFSGSLAAGAVGALWSGTTHAPFFRAAGRHCLDCGRNAARLGSRDARIEARARPKSLHLCTIQPEFS